MIIKKYILLCTVLLGLLTAYSVNATPRGPVQYDKDSHSLLTDDGQAFNGASFSLDIYGIQQMRKNEADYEAYFKSLVTEQGANAIQIAPWVGYWQDINAQDYWYQTHLDDLTYYIETTIRWAQEVGSYAVLSYGPARDLERAKAFWDIFGSQYKDTPHVLFEVTTDEHVRISRLKTVQLHRHLKEIAPNTHKLYVFAEQNADLKTAQRLSELGQINYTTVASVDTAVIDYSEDQQVTDADDYVVQAEVADSENRWDSVQGMAFEQAITFSQLAKVEFHAKAQYEQNFWVYLRTAEHNDVAAYYNTTAKTEWSTFSINASDFGLSGTNDQLITSVQFFIGSDSTDSHSKNVFFFDDVSVSSTDGNVQETHGTVDQRGTGWDVGYGKTTTIITQQQADEVIDYGDSYAIRSQLPGQIGNRWDSITGLVLENSAPIGDLRYISFDVKADVKQGFWVYLRDANDADIGAHYNTTANSEWQTIILRPNDFNSTSIADIASVQLFIGSAEGDEAANNAFYFDNISVVTSAGAIEGMRGKTDVQGTGWFELGYGHTNTVVQRDPSTETLLTPPPTSVAYNIEYQRSSGVDYYVSPQGDDSNDGLTSSTPFKDPQVAADIVGPGDRILLMPGNYLSESYESFIDLQNSGTADNWISIEAEVPGTVHFDINGSIGVLVNGAAYVRVKGLSMKGVADTLTPQEAEALRLENPYSMGLVGNGIGTETRKLASGDTAFPHHLIFEDNTVSWMSGGCIGTKRADYILIRNNEVHHCGLYNIWAQSGISVWENHNYDDNVDTYRTVITGNRSYSNYNHFKFFASSDPQTADSYTDGNGIIIDALAIDQGYLSDGANGVYTGRTLVENNLTYNNGGKGINVFASDNIDIIHNTSYKNGQHPEIPGELALGITKNVRVLNNIIYAAAEEPVFFAFQTQNILIDNNVIYKDVPLDSSFDNTNMATNSIENTNPLLVMPSETGNADFTVNHGSVAIDAAITTELKNFVDFNGNPRPQGIAADIGAFEQ